MPVFPQAANDRSYALTINGFNITPYVEAESVIISESGAEMNSTLEFRIEDARNVIAGGWAMLNNGPDVQLWDTVNARPLFGGTLVRRKASHGIATGIIFDCQAVSYDAWLDWRAIPRWQSSLSTDRAMVQSIIGNHAGMLTARNAEVASTRSGMPSLDLTDVSVRQALQAVADAAATKADPTQRRFYVDFHKRVHYFKGSEGTSAPYGLGDRSYVQQVRDHGTVVSYWTFREATGDAVYDTKGYANATLFGGYTRDVASGVPNEPGMRATSLSGTAAHDLLQETGQRLLQETGDAILLDVSTGYATATGNNLHPGDTFTIEMWFKRSRSGTQETLISAGVGDYLVEFLTNDKVTLTKEGTGTNVSSTTTYTDTNWHHLAITRSPGTTTIYVDGVNVTGTPTARTFVADTGTIYIGRRKSADTFYFAGSLQHIAIYPVAVVGATITAHYNYGIMVTPDEIDYEISQSEAIQEVYIRGGTSSGTGWYQSGLKFALGTVQEIIDREQSTSLSAKEAIGAAYLGQYGPAITGGRAVVTGFDGWRAGQTVSIDDDVLVTEDFQIRQLVSRPNFGSGVTTHEIYFGSLPWSGTFQIARRRRR